ncbi:MAG: hypothetical protein B9S26_05890 [Opitutia bacterium Tous-C4FEB]|nr:MAG: hypothetical protein B9S35_05985 [Opitutae bacterium Tous-C5TDCM]PAW90198.1 MAG: hypothetical protein B9S26_05890 [Opitutae bacterium Tous-C4FEB]
MYVCLFAAMATGGAAEGKPGYGISSWAGWKPGQISPAECPELRSVPLILKWDSLEPASGRYAFAEELGRPLQAAQEGGLYITLMIWVGPAAPEWIYQSGVPRVITNRNVNALGQKTDGQKEYPYYLHPEYKKRFMGLIDAFGKYVSALPPALRARIVFVQCAEGSTGDGQPYKGKPLDQKYAISDEVWNDFRLEAWKRYRDAVPGIPILVNSDANGGLETQWLLENMDVIALKQGMFSHGFQVSDNGERLAKFQALEAAAKQRGKPVLTRGEMDGELFEMGWSKRNIPQALYWSGIFATHCRLDIWNVPYQALKDRANWPAGAFFNKYAGHKDPATAPAAFCALRDGLDASDFNRFPASEFGGKPGQKKEVDRYLRITKAYASYGALMADPEKAIGGGMINRKSSGPNDVGWDILSGNYSRFLTQIEPGSGDVGRWNIDESIYGRFGRAFEHQSGKKQLRFQLDPRFAAKQVKVSVTYLDQGTGSWSIGIPGKEGATRIQNTNSRDWRTQVVSLSGMTELVLNYETGDNTLFHLIEVERAASHAK